MTASFLLGLFLLTVAVSVIIGTVRGLNKTLIRMATLVPAVILPFFLAVPAARKLADSIRVDGRVLGEWLSQLLEGMEYGELLLQSPILREAVVTLPAFLLAILMLPSLFLLLWFVSWVIYCMIRNPLRRLIFKEDLTREEETGIAEKMGAARRFGGMAFGLVTGIVFFGVMMAPTFGLFTTLPESDAMERTLEVMEESDLISREIRRDIQGIYSVTDCPLVKGYRLIGGAALGRDYLNKASEVRSDGQTMYLTDEIETLLSAVQTALEGGLTDRTAAGAALADKEFVQELVQKLFGSRIFCAAAPAAASAVTKDLALGMQVSEEKAEEIARSVYRAVSQSISKDAAAAETADTLADIVSDLAGAADSASDESGDLIVSDLDFDLLGDAAAKLQNSNLKDLGSAFLDMFASGELGNNSLVREFLFTVKEHYDDGDDIRGITGTAGALIGLASSMEEGSMDRDKQARAVNGLINNLNAETVDILLSVFSEEKLADMGVSAEYTNSTYVVVETLFLELLKLEGEDDYENEVDSILILLEIVGSSGTGIEQENMEDLARCAMESDAIYNTLMSISGSDPFGIEIKDKELCKVLEEDIESAYAKSGKTERERKIYYAIAALLGIEKNVSLR